MQEEYITFATRSQILARLRERSAKEDLNRERFYERISDRLAERTYDSGAFSFIVMEVVYDSGSEAQERADMLTDCILALTRDKKLAIDTLHAFEEITP